MAIRAKAVPKEKHDAVQEVKDLISKYKVVAALNLENLPTRQLQLMRASLRDGVAIKVTKRRLFNLALEESKNSKEGVEKLIAELKGMPGLLFTNENPFSLYKKLEKSKSNAPAKAGQTAPKDIIVKAGSTNFAPGPIIGELGAVGIKAGIDAGKVIIKQDSVVVKEGQIIKANVASILTRLGVEPMEIGLNVVAVYENGLIYKKDVLAVDEKQFLDNITLASRYSINLAVEIGYASKDTIITLIQSAERNAQGLQSAIKTE
jgi:large subunit ribosomal protein L10